MKNIFLAVAAFFALAAPAAAQTATNSAFTGPRVELNAGTSNLGDDFNYGAAVGADLPLGDRLTIGAQASVNDVFNRDRSIGADARLGLALNRNLLVYGTVGYADYRLRGYDGLRYGGGAELALSRFTFLKGEYRRSDGDVNTVLAGVGLRF